MPIKLNKKKKKKKKIFSLSNNQYDLEFEIEKNERFCPKTKEKITQAISKVIPWVPEVFSHGPMILRFGGHLGKTKT